MLKFIGDYDLRISKLVANDLWSTVRSKGLDASISSINRKGECVSCRLKLENVRVTKEEFTRLSEQFLEKVLIRKNVFLKSSPKEVVRFENFLTKTLPYDIVIDGLNVAYSMGTKSPANFARLLAIVVKHFSAQHKHILVLGRVHMNRWPTHEMDFIRKNASMFLTDDLSQDDPYLLYAAIKSGPTTDFFSRDLMRSHSFLLGKELGLIFRRWQQLHQYWLIHASDNGKMLVKEPVKFCTNAHQVDNVWHIPFDEEFNPQTIQGSEMSKNWLCVKL